MNFECPRCTSCVDEEFYGPCSSCRQALRTAGLAPRTIDAGPYEPKANVVPNQVATKD